MTRRPHADANASRTVDFPDPFAPTSTVTPGSSSNPSSTSCRTTGSVYGQRPSSIWPRSTRSRRTGAPGCRLPARHDRHLHAQAGLFEYRGRWGQRMDGAPVLARSHGEGFLEVLSAMSGEPGLYLMDEPESALSFDSCLVLLALLTQMLASGSQVVLATHSPVLAAVPGGRILQFGEHGVIPVGYDDTDLVVSWRQFLDGPQRYLRHLR